MKERARDQALLSALDDKGRATLEALVDTFIRTELPADTPEMLRDAADMFEDVGIARPLPDGITGFLLAALLRERAARRVSLRMSRSWRRGRVR